MCQRDTIILKCDISLNDVFAVILARGWGGGDTLQYSVKFYTGRPRTD